MLRTALVVLCVVACSMGERRAKTKTSGAGSGQSAAGAGQMAAGSGQTAAGSGSGDSAGSGAGSDASSCGTEILIDATGVTIGTQAGACRATRVDGKLDVVWAEKQLYRLKGMLSECSDAVVAQKSGPYQELISLMDIAVKTGFIDVGVGDSTDLRPMMTNARDAECKLPPPPPKKPRTTPAVQWVPEPRWSTEPLEDPITLPPPADPKETLQRAPVVIVTKTEITYQGKLVASVDAVAKDQNALKPLADRLRAADAKIKQDLARGKASADVVKSCEEANRGIRPLPGQICPLGLAILQADESTDMRVVNAILHTGKAVGFDNFLFAVKDK